MLTESDKLHQERGRIRADFVSYIYDRMEEATKAYLMREREARKHDPEGKYATFSDAFIAQYLGDAMAYETAPLEARLDELKTLLLNDNSASFELIAKVQLWACGLWGALTALEVGHKAELAALRSDRGFKQ